VDALRIEPAGAGGSAPSTVSVGGAGGGPVPCVSSVDCPVDQPVCDTITGVCTECLELDDCAHRPGTVCGFGMCVCPTEGHDWCAPADCVDLQTSPKHCGSCDHACFGSCSDGACTDPWEPVASRGAPSPRARHAALWDDSRGLMIVWGGTPDGSSGLATGAMYDPAASEWTAMTPVGAPPPRMEATAVWTGTHAIVWGGRHGAGYYADGALFDPGTNTWTPMTQSGAPSPRARHSAVWTGTHMLVWGGADDSNQLATGGRYDPASNSWESMATAPSSREDHSALWNDQGSRMYIYGGFGDGPTTNNVYFPGDGEPGGRSYDPATDSWDLLSQVGEPPARARHTAIWDGMRMIVFGGDDGSGSLGTGFKLEGNTWNALTGPGPSARGDHSAAWIETAGVMVVYGGRDGSGALDNGAVYDGVTGEWVAPVPNAIAARYDHSVVSADSRMIVWGGFNSGGGALGDGAQFRP
jgi:hypothetical protein